MFPICSPTATLVPPRMVVYCLLACSPPPHSPTLISKQCYKPVAEEEGKGHSFLPWEVCHKLGSFQNKSSCLAFMSVRCQMFPTSRGMFVKSPCCSQPKLKACFFPLACTHVHHHQGKDRPLPRMAMPHTSEAATLAGTSP